MTDKEKILALEIENARMGVALLRIQILEHEPYCPKICECPCVIAEQVLTAQPPSDVMEKLNKVYGCIVRHCHHTCEDMDGNSIRCSKCQALTILKELGIE